MDLEFLLLDVGHLFDGEEMEQTLFDASDKILRVQLTVKIFILILEISI